MLCPKCGKELPDNSIVCPDCGGISPLNENFAAADNVYPAKKKSQKAGLIAGIAVFGAVAVAVPTVIILGNNNGRKQLESHPTVYVMSAMGTHLSQIEKDSPFKNLFGNSSEKGVFTVKQTYNDSEAVRIMGYDRNSGKLYIETNEQFVSPGYSLMYLLTGSVSNYLFGSNNFADSSLEPKNHIRFYTDIDTVNLDYGLSDLKGNYYLDSANIRKDYDSSVFADPDSSYYNESFKSFIDGYEKVYNLLKKKDTISADVQKSFKNIVKSLEKNGHVAISNENVTIDKQTVSADTVLYQFNYDDLYGFMQDSLNEAVDFVELHKEDFDFGNDTSAMIDSMKKSFDFALDGYKKSAGKDLSLTFKFFLDTGKNVLLKAETNVAKLSDNAPDIHCVLEFPADSETLMSGSIKVEGSENQRNDGDMNIKVTKISEGQTDTYRMSLDYSGYTIDYDSLDYSDYTLNYDSYDMKPIHETLELTGIYDKANSTLTLKNVNSSPSEYMTPPATLSDLYTYGSGVLNCNFELKFNFRCSESEFSISDDTFSAEYSANAAVPSFKGEKNVFAITEEELDKISSAVNGSSNYNSDDSVIKYSNASLLDAACKKLYAGVAAGAINAESPVSELGSLDVSKLPAKGAKQSEMREAADNLTIQDAIDYDKLGSVFENESPYDYGYSVQDGTIVYLDGETESDFDNYELITYFDYVTLGTMYKSAMG